MKVFHTKSFLALVVFLGIVSFVSFANAFSGMSKLFGGRITMTSMPGVTCTSQYGVFSLQGPKGFKSQDFIITSTDKNISTNKWIMGYYSSMADEETCYTGQTPYRIPYTSYSVDVKKFNTSK